MGNFKNQDVLDLEKQLEEKTAEYTGKDDFLGVTLLSFPQYTSATRLTMYVSNMKQYNVLNNPEPPKVFGGYENLFGKYSSALVRADADYEVYAKIDKFMDYPGHIYLLFLYDKEHDRYDVIQKKITEELTENYGFRYNNTFIDKLKVGDTIEQGQTLYKSSSYDEDDNYCFGRNVRVAYMLAPGNIEDAYVFRKGFVKNMVSIKNDIITFSVNDNDFLINWYGDSKHYRPLPDIGVEIKERLVAARRRQVNDQILYDMKNANMMRPDPLSDKPFFTMGGIVTDINIYSNKKLSDIPETIYNEQIIYYLRNQNRYYREILKVCEDIVHSGSQYSDDIGYLYARVRENLDPNYVWKHNEDVFGNFMIEIHTLRDIELTVGSKTTGRYGDKGVVSELVDDDKMPFTADGVPLDAIVNPLSCPNRLNPFQWIECDLNHCSRQIIKQMQEMDTDNKRFKHLQKYLKYFNEREELDQLTTYYKGLSTRQRKQFWEDIYQYGIYINYPPMWDSKPAIEKLEEIHKEFGIEREQLFIRKWGRVIPLMHKLIVGEKYMLKLKQTSEKNFSARSTGYLSQKNVPEKSNKVKSNENLYSTTPITIGRDENNNLGIGVDPFILAKTHLFYRTSPIARREIKKTFTKDALKFKKFKIKRGFTNRNVEILNAKMKSLGLEIRFPFDGLRLNVQDNSYHTYTWKGKTYIRTRDEMREILLDELLRQNFFTKDRKGKEKELEREFQKYKRKEISKIEGKLVLDLDGVNK